MRTFTLCIAFTGVFLLLGGRFATAGTIYVNNVVGDDVHSGTEPESTGGDGPVRTLQKALRICRSGDRIVLAKTEVPYRESISLSTTDHCGNALSPFVIDGQGAVLEGTEPILGETWESVQGTIFRFRPSRTSYQQLFLDDRPATQRKLVPGDTHLPKLEPLEWYRRGAWIYFCVEADKLPRQYNLACSARQTGVTLYHVHDVIVMNLTVQGFRLDGVNINDGVDGCEVLGITSRGNGRSGITVAGSSKVRIEKCVIGDNGEQQLLVEGTSATVVDECELIANTAPAVTNRGAKLAIHERAPSSEDK